MTIQFIKNIENAIQELQHQEEALFIKEQFLNDILCESEHFFTLVDNMDEKEFNETCSVLRNKLFSVTSKQIAIVHQIDILRELKEDTIKRIEADEQAEVFFKNLFE